MTSAFALEASAIRLVLGLLQVLEEVEVGPLHTKGKIEFMPLDLAVPSSVHQFAQAFHDKNLQLGLLICNAGIMAPPQRCVAENNVELQFQVMAGARPLT